MSVPVPPLVAVFLAVGGALAVAVTAGTLQSPPIGPDGHRVDTAIWNGLVAGVLWPILLLAAILGLAVRATSRAVQRLASRGDEH